jgi:alkaline phosphatase D
MGVSRRTILKMLAASSVLSACDSSTAPGSGIGDTRICTSDIDFNIPDGWDYPVAESLLPFGNGVGSGDPLADRVILWTRISVPDARGWRVADPQGLNAIPVAWVIATDPDLVNVVRSGVVSTTRELDWTVKIDADQLESATTYYYAFAALGRTSMVGRTRTAPGLNDDVRELRIVNIACTSYWSMDFHPYSRIAERDDLDLVCHAGDHVYEFVDTKQWYRARKDRFDLNDVDFRNWRDKDENGRRYALYYSDPDLLKARQSVPFCIIGDNHDWDNETDPETGIEFTTAESAQVFWLWTACRPPLPDGSGEFAPSPGPNAQVPVPRVADAMLQYRHLPYGRLGHVVMLDMRYQRDAGAETPLGRLLGDRQVEWLKRVLLQSKENGSAFRMIVNQINMSQLGLFNPPAGVLLETLGLDLSGPDIYPGWGQVEGAREAFYGFLRENGIIDNLVYSGDSHGWFAYDLVEDNALPAYNPLNGRGTLGSVGVELVPSAFGRPGGAEVIAGELYSAANGGPPLADSENFRRFWVPPVEPLVLAVETAAQLVNANLRYFNWRTYGYGLSHITADETIMELWEVPYPQRSDDQTLLRQFRIPVGQPHLNPVLLRQATTGERAAAPAPVQTATRRSFGCD